MLTFMNAGERVRDISPIHLGRGGGSSSLPQVEGATFGPTDPSLVHRSGLLEPPGTPSVSWGAFH